MNVLIKEILENKRREVESAKKKIPLASMKRMAHEADPPRPFIRSIRECKAKHKVIAELKRVSPGTGFRRNDFNPVAIGKGYWKAGATAISVLTDAKYFGGSLDFLREVRGSVSIPCMRKDFIIDRYQVYEARAWGADALLVMAVNFDGKSEIDEICGTAYELGMDVLFEVHTEDELEMAPDKRVALGINNRDFRSKDLNVDLSISRRLLPVAKAAGFGLVVCESGIRDAETMREMEKAGADAFLIGSAFMESPDPAAALKKFLAG